MENRSNFSIFCLHNRIPACYIDATLKNLKMLDPVVIKFIKRPFPMMIGGEPGTGKTYFLLALIRYLLEVRRLPPHMIRFITAIDLDDRVDEEFKKSGSAKYFLQGLQEDYFLFIDDFGVEKSKERAERNYYTLLDHRLGNSKPTILTTNLKEEEILNVYGARIHSRLKQCFPVILTGEDKRKPPIL